MVRVLTGACLALAMVSPAAAQTSNVDPGAIAQEFELAPEGVSTGKPVLSTPLIPGAPELAGETAFLLESVRIEGATVFSAATLSAYAGPLIGKEVTLSDIYQVSVKITRSYADAGYPLSVAIVPAQEIDNGEVLILVYEGYVSDVEIAGDPGAAAPMLRRLGEKLKKEQPLSRATLERYLLLANDLPGVNVRGIFDRSTGERGALKLVLEAEADRFSGSLWVNNRGSRVLGRGRAVVRLNQGGAVTGREAMAVDFYQTFDGDELTYVQSRNQFAVNAEGTVLQIAGTFFDSRPGDEILRAADFNSDGWTVQFGLEHPIIRARDRNLRGFISFEANQFQSQFGTDPNSDDKLRVFRAGLIFDSIDANGGTVFLSGTISRGTDLFDATSGADPLASRAIGSGTFTSFNFDLGRRQPIIGDFELYVSGGAQIASRGLLSSEECGYGGAGYGRGFDNYEISGDHCAFGAVELRKTLVDVSPTGPVQPYVFYDVGSVWQRGPLEAGEDDQETGMSAGGGLRVRLNEIATASVEYAKPFNRDVSWEGDRDGRVFFAVTFTP